MEGERERGEDPQCNGKNFELSYNSNFSKQPKKWI
jgi:hypothetical protein